MIIFGLSRQPSDHSNIVHIQIQPTGYAGLIYVPVAIALWSTYKGTLHVL